MMSACFKVHFKQIFVMVGKQATWENWPRKALSTFKYTNLLMWNGVVKAMFLLCMR